MAEVAQWRSRLRGDVGVRCRLWQFDRRVELVRIDIDNVGDRDGKQYDDNEAAGADGVVVCAGSPCSGRARNALPNYVLGSDLRHCHLGRLLNPGRGHP